VPRAAELPVNAVQKQMLALRRDCARRWHLTRRELAHAESAGERRALCSLLAENAWTWRLVRMEMRHA
jgi:hypothetical protein